MAELAELLKDVEEAKSLIATATRQRWRNLLSAELTKLEAKVKTLQLKTENDKSSASAPPQPKTYSTVIRNYSWDQSDKFLKLYVTLPGVQNLPRDDVKCTFDKQNLCFEVINLDGRSYSLTIILAYPIVPDKSYIKIKTDSVVIFASKKETGKTWEAVSAEEKKAKDLKMSQTKKPSANKDDPSSGLMDVMKQMYDDGDDEMKRMLNKTWYESQNKKAGGGDSDDMGGMPNMMGMGGMPNMADMGL